MLQRILDARRRRLLIFSLICAAAIAGCRAEAPSATTRKAGAGEVVIYCSVDRAFAEPLLDAFERDSGIEVHARFDTEAGKTTGLVNKLLAEKSQPRADVWWSSEVFGTVELAESGVLDSYEPTTAQDIPAMFRDDDGMWTAFGLRGRVIAFDPKRTERDEAPKSWGDLARPAYRDRVAMADPRFGTTRGHFAAMLSEWGEGPYRSFLTGLKSNQVLRADGNSHAVLLLAQGRVDFAATDTDDVIVAKRRGDSIEAVYPDMTGPDGETLIEGTLWIPCSVGLVQGARNNENAKRLIDHIASVAMEKALHDSDSRNVPVRAALRKELGIEDVRAAEVDYRAVAAALKQSAAIVAEVRPFDGD